MARILIVGGGCRGRRLATAMVDRGHALRVTTRGEHNRAAIEATGAECVIGTPDRLATLRGALDGVTVACWMLAAARGDGGEVAELHGSRLRFFLSQVIDTTVRGLVYDACPVGSGVADDDDEVSAEALTHGAELVRSLTQLNAIPAIVLGPEAVVADDAAWVAAASTAIDSLLGLDRVFPLC